MTHTTLYEDDGGVGLLMCGDKYYDWGKGPTLDTKGKDAQPETTCPICKKRIRLIWDVRVEVVE